MGPGEELAWSAFWHLKDDRVWTVNGFGAAMAEMFIESLPQHISYLAISAYAQDAGIVASDFDRFLFLVRSLDDEYVQILNEDMEARWRERQTRWQQRAAQNQRPSRS